jgi:methyl-accepting chemotaxis protein
MNELHQQVARARRRLVLEQYLGRCVWCLFAALVVAAIAVAVPRVFAISNLPERWDSAWLIGALVTGLVAAAVWTLVARRTSLDAAIEIDKRFDLRERVASSLSLSKDELNTEAGQALLKDAVRAAGRIDVNDKFRVRLDRRAWLPLVPAVLAFLVVAFFNPREATSSVDPAAQAKEQEQTKKAMDSFRQKLEEQKKLAKEQGLNPEDGLFKQLEQGAKELTEKKDIDKSKAAVKLNDLAKQLEERREQLGGKESMQKQLQNLKNLGAGPAEKIAEAMKQGDFKKALEEVNKLAKDIKEGKLDAQAKEQLAKQLEQMKEKMEAAAQAHQQAMEDLKKQIEQEKQRGNIAKAGELQQKLDQMQQQLPQMNKLQQLANQMGQAQKGLQQGDAQKAAQAMAQMAQQMEQMQQEMNEMKMLDAAMNQLDMAKDAMMCKNCNGEGCEMCQGGMAKNGEGKKDGKPGRGMGKGVGIGPRPEEQDKTNTRDTQVRQKPGQGAAVIGGFVDGPNIKGEVGQSIKEEMANLSAEPADPLTSDRLPHTEREHAEEYFKALREGR